MLIRPVLYQDLSKKASDLLSKDFPDKNKVQLNTKASNGMSFEASIVKNADDSIIGVVSPKFAPADLARHGVTLGATIDTNRTVKVEAEATNFVHGLTTRIIGDTRSDTVTLEGNYKHDYLTVNGSVEFFNPHGINALVGTTLGYDGMSVGLQTRLNNSNVTALNASAAYATPDFTASVWGELKHNRVGLNYFQRVHARLLVGAEAAFDTMSSAKASKLTLGGRYDIEPTSGAFCKAKIDTEGKLAVSYGQRLNQYAQLTIGGAFNTNSFAKAGGHNFGFTLALND